MDEQEKPYYKKLKHMLIFELLDQGEEPRDTLLENDDY